MQKLSAVLALALALALALPAAAASAVKETPIPDEEKLTAEIVQNALQAIEKSRAGGPARRDVHAKGHGCLKGTLTMAPGRPPSVRQGLFAKDGTYQIWSRFSNASGAMQSDSSPDARGAALKLLGVPGAKLSASDPAGHNLDLLFFTEPVTPVRDAAGYAKIQKLAGGDRNALVYTAKHPAIIGTLLKAGLDGALVADPLEARYYSAAPYLLGAGAAKYHLKPCAPSHQLPATGADHLKTAMARHLAASPACFELFAQLFVDEKSTPIEDYSVEWTEAVSPLHAVATINFPKQTFDSPGQGKFCEALSFDPWRTLAEHRPLGNLNRVRRALYEAISKRRHADNKTARAEPTGDERF